MTSYQRLRKENAELRRQLNLVCLATDSAAAQVIIARISINNQVLSAIWSAGDTKNPDGSKFDGFIK